MNTNQRRTDAYIQLLAAAISGLCANPNTIETGSADLANRALEITDRASEITDELIELGVEMEEKQ